MTASARPRLAVALWLVVLALGAWQLARTRIIADLGAFLPPSATPAQQILLEQMKSGVASRIVLIGLSGAPEDKLAEASRALAAGLRNSGLFATVQNGAEEGLRAEREALMAHRYVLSPALSPERFSASMTPSSIATMFFMSTAPRPQTMPSTRSPPNGSRDHASASTGTTSMWLSRISGGSVLLPVALRRAKQDPRLGVGSMTSASIPAPARTSAQ